jgi:hypothetical protein
MTDCIHRRKIVMQTHMMCGHSDSPARGVLPLTFCDSCPLRRPKGDFFAQTEQLLIKKQTSGEYKPQPKSCGGCGSTKKRETPLQFVWPYWHGGAVSDEIRWSVRSVEKFFDGQAECVIIGDKPPWYTGKYIAAARVSGSTPNRAFRDMLAKMWIMATHPEIHDEFVWMMDDIYFLKPFSKREIMVPRAYKWHPSEGNSWQRRKTNTMRALEQAGRTTHDFATHAPHHVEKAKLKALFEEFKLHENTMLWEVLYGNTYRAAPKLPQPWFLRINKAMDMEHIRKAADKATVCNNTNSAFNAPLREFLNFVLPEPGPSEGAEVPAAPKFRKVRKGARKVKRRR